MSDTIEPNTNELHDIAVDMINNPDLYSCDDVVEILELADDLYSNDGESFIEDNEYDVLRLIAHRLDPSHVYFTGVGSSVRGGKVKLPFELGSLDQVEIGDIAKWVHDNRLEDEEIVITDKMDGTSALILFGDDGLPQIAYSRGNGTEGADISRHIFKIKNVPAKVSSKMNIRAEVELTESAFEQLRKLVKSKSGKTYKNARNMVAGIMNSSERPAFVYNYLTVVAYEIVGSNMSKLDMLETIEENGFQCVEYKTCYGSALTDDMLSDYLNSRRKTLDYAIDGLVLDVESAAKRSEMNPTRDTLNPAYSIKYKVADASNMAIATVKSVTWNESKDGYWKPQVNIHPIELCNVTISNATGFNARFIVDNKIGPGAKIRMTRSGDVIPFILECVEPAEPSLPTSNAKWNETNVDLVMIKNTIEVDIQQTIEFVMSIDAPHLKEGTVREVFSAKKFETAEDAIVGMLTMDKQNWSKIIGANGVKIYNGLQAKMANMPMFVLLGSVPFFGRGVGKRKFKKLIDGLKIASINELPFLNRSQIESVHGFKGKTALKIVSGVGPFMKFYERIADVINLQEVKKVSTGIDMQGQKVCMTGFRDVEMQSFIENSGGVIQSAASSKTTLVIAKDANSNSGKIKVAKDLGITVISKDEFEAKYMSKAAASAPVPKAKKNNLLEF